MDTSTIAVWLAVIAVSSVIQTAITVAAALAAWRAYRHGTEAVARFRAKELEPLILRVRESLDDVRGAVDRVKAVDDDVRDVITRVGGHATNAVASARLRALPVVAFARALSTALRTFRGGARRGTISARAGAGVR